MKRLLLGLLGLALWASAAHAVVNSTTMGNANYTAVSTDQRIWLTVAFTTNRTLTLPAAAGTCIGQTCPPFSLEIIDTGSAVNANGSLIIAPASGDTINGSSSSVTITGSNLRITLIPISGTNWVMSITGAPGSGVFGTTTNDNACTGCVGELQTSSTASNTNAGGTLLTTVTAANAAVLAGLTAGDWDCRANATYNANATTVTSGFSAWISSVTAAAYAVGTNNNGAQAQIFSPGPQTGSGLPGSSLGNLITLSIAPVRFSLAAATTLFVSTSASFITSTASSFAFLGCRRVR